MDAALRRLILRPLPLVLLLLLQTASGGHLWSSSAGSGPGMGQRFLTKARARHLMGTRLSIELPTKAPDRGFDSAFDEVDRLERILSNWKESSELSRLNRNAAAAPFSASPDLLHAVTVALEWAETTGGAFDPTVDPIVRRLGLRDAADGSADRTGSRVVPEEGSTEVVGWRHVAIDRELGSIRFDAEGIGIDLGGIGKGIALDAAGRILRRMGIEKGLLDFGGQVLAIGSGPEDAGWIVGIADPDRRDRAVAVVRLHHGSIATSGNSEQASDVAGASIGHILDPERGESASFRGSVTVVASDGTSADALSTALFVMGPERGLEWAETKGQAALYLWRRADGRLVRRATSGMRKLLESDHGDGAASSKARQDNER